MLKTYNKVLIWLFVIAAIVFIASQFSTFRSLDRWLLEQRSAFTERQASENFVFVGIDSQSIQDIGVWPWPRSVHAEVIDRLTLLDVNEIGIDIDFSSRSSEQEDQALEDALIRANGTVTLPIFVQDRSASSDDNTLSVSAPLKRFSDNTWLATPNLVADDDGIVRRFPTRLTINEEVFDSLPLALSHATVENDDDIHINFSIDPSSVPVYSVSDLLRGLLKRESLEGKTVIYGAQAVELRDNFTVPVHTTLPGAMVQILAAETLYQNVQLQTLDFKSSLLLGLALIISIFCIFQKRMIATQIAILFGLGLLFEAAAFWAFSISSIVVPTAAIHIFILLIAGMALFFAEGFQRIQAIFQGTEKRNAQKLLDQVFEDNICGLLVIDNDGSLLKQNSQSDRFFRGLSRDKKANISQLPETLQKDIRKMMVRSGTKTELKIGATIFGELNLSEQTTSGRILEYAVTKSFLSDVSKRNLQDHNDQQIICVTAWDVTEQREQKEQLQYLAQFDVLTSALHRRAFEEKLDEGHAATVLAINLHRFKTINMTLGRDVGNVVLTEVVTRIKQFSDETMYVARIGGDSFAVSIQAGKTGVELTDLAKQLLAKIKQPFSIQQAGIQLGARIGAASQSKDQNQNALQLAEIALDEARKTQGDQIFIHKDEVSQNQLYARRIEADLWKALDQNEFSLAYQPQVNLADERLTGAEALIRWKHSELGDISPGDFIDIAEANGFVDILGEWVLEKACKDALLLPEHMTIAVNISPAQLMRSNVPKLVERVLSRTLLPPNQLNIEITEAGFLEASKQVVSDLERLRDMGVLIALDDFGTGFSSLGYFANFPIGKIKVDQMFIRTLERGSKNEAIVRSIKTLSEGLNLKMICEGIETADQLKLLREIGVHEGQGYYFGKPEPFSKLLEFPSHSK